jgi:hypothetical protein
MIQPLRAAHRSAFLILGISLPVFFVVAIASRNANSLAQVTVPNESAVVQTIGNLYFYTGDERVSLQLNRTGAGSESHKYVLNQTVPFPAPELLLYWSPSEASSSPPSDAILIGQFAPRREFSLPTNHDEGGYLLVYDAPHKRLLTTFPLGNHR